MRSVKDQENPHRAVTSHLFAASSSCSWNTLPFPMSPRQQSKVLVKTWPKQLTLQLFVAVSLTTVRIPHTQIRGVADPALLHRFSKYRSKQGGKKHKGEHDLISPKL